MPNVESISGKQRDFKICPYWRKFVTKDDEILALCGKMSPKEPRLSDTDIGPRLRTCPWYGADVAYKDPTIILVDRTELELKPNLIVQTGDLFGARAVKYLEMVWDQVVECFYEDRENIWNFVNERKIIWWAKFR